MNILLVGAGRMGLRHLRGLTEVDGKIHVVDPRVGAETAVRQTAIEYGLRTEVVFGSSLDRVPWGTVSFDAAILSATAQGRLDCFECIAAHGIQEVLVEKPIEQSRKRLLRIAELAQTYDLNVRCNHYRRELSFYTEIRRNTGPSQVIVSGGAFGLGCNGIHWIDLALYLSKSNSARLLWGEIESTTIASGRGPAFRDYGGRGVFGFGDGSRLILSSAAASSAPATITITQPTCHYIIDQERNSAIAYDRQPGSTKPNYLYGADYDRRDIQNVEDLYLRDVTRRWICWLKGQGVCSLPTLGEALIGHGLLFDLLETSGISEFPIT